MVKASLFAYEAKTGRLVWESAPLLNAQGVRDHFVMGSGPYRLSSRGEVEQYPDESQSRPASISSSDAWPFDSDRDSSVDQSDRVAHLTTRSAAGPRGSAWSAACGAGRGARPWADP